MASKVLVPAAPFAKLQVKKSPPEQSTSGFIIGGSDAAARIAHLEHSVRFLQEQHRLMLSGLHAEIEALRERNRDLQFQLIFNKESSPKSTPPTPEDNAESNEEANLKKEVARLEQETAAAKGEARAAEARALQLQELVNAQAEKLRELELKTCSVGPAEGAEESRTELRARLADAERLVRRLRATADRQRTEVPAGVTNLLFDGAHARHAHLQCMKNSLHASLRASGLDGYYQTNYHFPPVHAPEFWREPLREEVVGGGVRAAAGGRPRPLALPGLTRPRCPGYAHNQNRSRTNGYEHKNKKSQSMNAENVQKTPDESPETRISRDKVNAALYPELKVVIAKLIAHDKVAPSQADARRPRRHRRHPPET